jgi:DNA polymerase-3 subunit epsilon
MMEPEEMAAALEATGNFKVLRRVAPRDHIYPPDGSGSRRALYVDTETTGLSPSKDEIIELAMVPFNYGPDGRIFEILTPFQSFREPSIAIPAEITRITGIDQSMVAGHRIDLSQVEAMVAEADLIIAHNAGFDRRFLERLTPSFITKPWGCSATQVDWRAEGFEGSRLGYLVSMAGYFYDRHRALNDCYAAVELLSKPTPKSGKIALEILLANARSVTMRLWATHAPFDLKDNLKQRGYRWNNGEYGTQKAWYIDVPIEKKDDEVSYLQTEIFGWEAPIHATRIDAYDRFSDRAV